jgi:hypothetical protein
MTDLVIIEGEFIVICGGGARPGDTHLDSTIHCVNDEIFEYLEWREGCERDRSPQIEKVRLTPIYSA